MRCGQRKEYPEAHKPDNYECNAAMNNRDLLSNKVEGNDWYLRLYSDIHNLGESTCHDTCVPANIKATKFK